MVLQTFKKQLHEYAISLGLDTYNDKYGLLLIPKSWYIAHISDDYPLIYFQKFNDFKSIGFSLSDPDILNKLKEVILDYANQQRIESSMNK